MRNYDTVKLQDIKEKNIHDMTREELNILLINNIGERDAASHIRAKAQRDETRAQDCISMINMELNDRDREENEEED